MQDGRTSLMHQVADKGILEGCSGTRLTQKGRPVELIDLVAFNVEGADGGVPGLACGRRPLWVDIWGLHAVL